MKIHDVHSRELPAPADRVSKLIEGPGADPLGRVVPGALATVAAVHAAWALGWRWPGGSDQALADRVVGDGAKLPPGWMTGLVAGAMLAGAAAVRAGANGAEGRVRLAAWTVAGTLLARGAAGVAVDLAGGVRTTYARLDLALYSPLCLALGAGTVQLLGRAPASPGEVAR